MEKSFWGVGKWGLYLKLIKAFGCRNRGREGGEKRLICTQVVRVFGFLPFPFWCSHRGSVGMHWVRLPRSWGTCREVRGQREEDRVERRVCPCHCIKPASSLCQMGVCGCIDGYTEVMSSDGQLDQCTLIPVLEIPTAGDNRADVKTIRGLNPTQPAASTPSRVGRTWFLQPFGPGNASRYSLTHPTAGARVNLMLNDTSLKCRK